MWKILLKGKSLIGKKKDIMKNFLSLLLPLAMLASGCAQEEFQNDLLDSQGGRVFTASFEQNETRTYLEEGSLLRWNAGDQIALFDGNTLNRKYKFDGETGDNSGTFSIVSNPFGTGNDLDCHYAVYPYASGVKITENGVITATLPAEQSYAENSFGICANTMVAVTKDLDDTFLKFKNVGGYLKLQLYGDDIIVKSISLTGGGNEKIAGKASITPVFGQEPVVTMSDDATSGIILNCGEGVKIGTTAESATAFWIVVPPTTFENGFVITITDINGETFTKSTSNEITVERNVIKPMKAFEVEMGNGTESEDGTIPNHQIWYTANAKVEPYWDDVFGANIVSNVWDSASGKGVITFDDRVTVIGKEAFMDCDYLLSVIMPNSVSTIGEMAFFRCSNLIAATIPDSVISIENSAFQYCNLQTIIIPDSVITIGDYAFYSCGLSSVTIGDNVTTIGEDAFAFCNFTSITIPDSVTSIDGNAFDSWFLKEFKGKFASEDGRCLVINGTLTSFAQAGLTEYAIPNNVITIGEQSFQQCSNLANITIGKNVKTISAQAFLYCFGLEEINIPNNVAIIEDAAFCDCSNLVSLTIGNGVTTIGMDAFRNCASLRNASIGDSVTTIESWAFEGCRRLEDLVLGMSLTTIRPYAFSGCTNLTNVTIPHEVTMIGKNAFYDCARLETVYCQATTPPVIYLDTFSGCGSDMKVYVPAGSIRAYKAAEYWKELNLIEEDSSVMAVDLGLSVKWANCNVGANSPEEAGGYYSWGEIEEKTNYDHSTYKWSANTDWANWKMAKYCVNSNYGTIDNKAVLDLDDDAANVISGVRWRMPTFAEFQELLDNCTWEWTSVNGVNGYKVSGNGNHIFFPASGCRYYDEEEVRYLGEGASYWSSTLNAECNDCADVFSFYPQDEYLGFDRVSRYPGLTIRPVENQ